jgi:hypothetical protein
MLGPLAVLNKLKPCELHTFHSPVTVYNEQHHVFPEYLQKRVWGKTLDQTKVSICATGHNTVHGAITNYLDKGVWPDYAKGKTLALAKEAVKRYQEASPYVKPTEHQ